MSGPPIPNPLPPPSWTWPPANFPPFPTYPPICLGPGCLAGGRGLWYQWITLPDIGAMPGWLLAMFEALLSWFALVLVEFFIYLYFVIVYALFLVLATVVNGLYYIIQAMWVAATSLASYTGPFAPITATVIVALWVIVIVLAVLWVSSQVARVIGKGVTSIEEQESGGGSSSSGGSDAEMEEVAEVAA